VTVAVLVASGFWTDAWRFTTFVDIGVAIGTISAAWAATRAVIAARIQAKASERQAAASEQEAAALLRPVLVDVPFDFARRPGPGPPPIWASDDEVRIRLPVRNVGPGPAFVDPGSVEFTADATEAVGESESGVIAAGGEGFLSLHLTPGSDKFPGFRSGIAQHRPLQVYLTYTDVGTNRYDLTLHVEWADGVGTWRVIRLGYKQLPAGDPRPAAAGPAQPTDGDLGAARRPLA
jgi:hypothetical protein